MLLKKPSPGTKLKLDHRLGGTVCRLVMAGHRVAQLTNEKMRGVCWPPKDGTGFHARSARVTGFFPVCGSTLLVPSRRIHVNREYGLLKC